MGDNAAMRAATGRRHGVSTSTQGHDGDERETLLHELFPGGEVPARVEGRFLRTREVALLFQVSERAVTDWARKGRIPSVRTPGGHRRYPAEPIREMLEPHRSGRAPLD
jgi:excisionase family DNA binding protein